MQHNQILLDIEFPIDKIWELMPAKELFTPSPNGLRRIDIVDDNLLKLQKLLDISKPIIECSIYKFSKECVSHRIHVDRHIDTPCKLPDVALNIPLNINSECFIIWYDQIDKSKTIRDYGRHPAGKDIPDILLEDVIEIERQALVKPHIVNIIQWHQVKNFSTTEDAYLLTLRLDKIYDHNDWLKILNVSAA